MAGMPALSDEQRSVIAAKAERLLDAIEQAPKGWSWRRRAKTGNKKLWYNEVSDWD